MPARAAGIRPPCSPELPTAVIAVAPAVANSVPHWSCEDARSRFEDPQPSLAVPRSFCWPLRGPTCPCIPEVPPRKTLPETLISPAYPLVLEFCRPRPNTTRASGHEQVSGGSLVSAFGISRKHCGNPRQRPLRARMPGGGHSVPRRVIAVPSPRKICRFRIRRLAGIRGSLRDHRRSPRRRTE